MDSLIPHYSVGELVQRIKAMLEDTLGYLRVSGEVTNFKKSSSGYGYFTLQEKTATINVVVFRWPASGPCVENGLNLEVWGRLTLYEGRSVYQIVAENFSVAGWGKLMAIIQERRCRLEAEGLFASKKPLPSRPHKVGLITASAGAALEDIKVALQLRYVGEMEILLYSSRMQGQEAEKCIGEGIGYLNNWGAEMIIIARGGGSREDLMCFNGEMLARTIHGSRAPVVTAIGHEVDWTIADQVADLRLPTPTAVAAILAPLRTDLEKQLDLLMKKIFIAVSRILDNREKKLANIFTTLLKIWWEHRRRLVKRWCGWVDRLEVFTGAKILRDGYALLRKNSKIIYSSQGVNSGDILQVELKDGKFTVEVL
jgi:exodeoxyribonuclease VII large subunit